MQQLFENHQVARRCVVSAIAFFLFSCLTGTLSAQQLTFGYFSYDTILVSLPDYQAAQEAQTALKAQYDAEAQRMADEFNNKYEEFIEVQRTLAPAILNKRQAELQALAENGKRFKAEAQQQLAQAKDEAMAPIRQHLNDVITAIGQSKGFAFILNTDNNTLPYIDPTQGEDITTLILTTCGVNGGE